MSRHRARASGLPLLAIALVASACVPADGPPPLPAGGFHRVQATPEAADALVARGAALVASYGAFRVLDARPELLASARPEEVAYRDEYLRIRLNARELDTSLPAEQALRAPRTGAEGKGLHLVQFRGPVRTEWLDRLLATGARIVSYAPANAYLVYGEAAALERLHRWALSGPEVQHDGPYLPEHKTDPSVATTTAPVFAVQLVEDAAVNAETLRLVAALGRARRVDRALGYVNAIVETDRVVLEEIARRPDVVSIQPWVEPRLRDERQDMIVAGQLTGASPTGPGYLEWLAAHGFAQGQFDASGFGVDVSDSGIDAGTAAPNHFGLYRGGDVSGQSRVAYVRLEGTPHAGSTVAGCDGHGTVNAHIVAGYSDRTGGTFADALGFRYGLGVAPFVRVGGSVIFDPDVFTSPDYEDLQSRAFADGMRMSSNSWGSSSSTYGVDAQRYDALVRDAAPADSAVPVEGNQEMVIVFAAGNSGPYAGTIGTPGNAKNVLSAGASENVHAFGGADQCSVSDSAADGALDMAYFSSRGPAADGRIRPDLVAPGTHVSGGVAQAAGQRAEPPASPSGQAIACYVASGVCGGATGGFHPPGQQWYTASSGTSHSTPAIAGAAALLRQRFLNEGLPAPSPAMSKAYLMNCARYMSGAGANDSLYSSAQGMGLLDLGAAFDDTPRLLRDQEPEDVLGATGQTRTFASAIGDTTRPFRVTLAWTDAPGATFAAAYKNDLDLTVEVGGTVYRGNVFSGATSSPGGGADYRNNVESVFLPAGTSGPFTVTVTAANLNSDGVPGNGTPVDQDFALVVWNGCAAPRPPTPAGVTATATADNQITLDWTSNGASRYLVYRSTSAGSGYGLVATVAAPPFVDAGRSGGTTYFYVVRAQEGCAVSGLSAEASATATGACLLEPGFGGLEQANTTGAEICGVLLEWSPATPRCGGEVRYDVFRSTAAGFVPGPENRIASGVAGASYVDTYLAGGTTYRYVVRAVETAVGTVVTDANTVERSAVPARVVVVYRDDLDGVRPPSPEAWWIERITQGSDDLAPVSGCRWQSPTTAYRFGSPTPTCGGAYGDGVRNTLVLGGDGTTPGVNGFAVPVGGSAALSFRLWYRFESYYDGANLAYSTTGAGGPFAVVPDVPTPGRPYIVSGGYDGLVYMGGRGWTGSADRSNGALREVRVDLGALAGQTVWFAWQFGTDSSVTSEGLYLDDVVLEVGDPGCISCSIAPPPPPGVVVAVPVAENQIEVSWASAGGTSFDVYRSTAAGGPYQLAGSVPASPFLDAGRSGGATYRYVVRSREGCAASVDSAEAAATATGACLLEPSFAGLASAASTGQITCGIALAWEPAVASCGGGLSYDVFRSTQAGFAPAPENRIAAGVEGTRWVDSGDLVSGQTYRYVVRAVEQTAGGPVSESNAVERHAAPRWMTGDFADDLDGNRPPSPGAYWIERVISGGDALAPVTGCRWQSPTTAYRFGAAGISCGGTHANSQQSLLVLGGDGSVDPEVNGFQIPEGSAPTLSFRLWYDFESRYDGARLAYSTTGASGTFLDVPDSASATQPFIVQGGYDDILYAGGRGWTGHGSSGLPSGGLKQVLVNLQALAGQTVWFGWRFTTDGSVTYEGLYLDDVSLVGAGGACSTTPVPPGAAIRFRVELPASTVAGGTTIATLTALDQYGQVAGGHSGAATLSSGDPAAVLPSEVTFANGLATAAVSFGTAGPQTLVVTDASNAAVRGTGSTQVAAGAPASLRLVTQPSAVEAGASFFPWVTVEIVDAFGNRTSSGASVAVSLGENPGGGTLQGSLSASAGAGLATFPTLWLDRAAQGYTLVASSAGVAPATSQTFTVRPSYASALAWALEPSASVAGQPITPPPAVEVRDRFGNVADWVGPVTVTLAAGPAGATLAGTTTGTATSGRATFDDLRLDRAGAGYVLRAVASFFSVLSGDFGVVPAGPHRVVLTSQPQDVPAGVAFSPPLSAVLLDPFDNLTTEATTEVSLSFASNPSGGLLVGATHVAAAGGQVTFPGVAVDRPGQAYALYVGASGLYGDASLAFDVLAGPVARYQIEGPSVVPAGTEVSYRLRALDGGGNRVEGYVGQATATSSDPLAELPATAAFTGGEAFPVRIVLRTAGSQTIAFADAAAPAIGGSLEVTVGASQVPAGTGDGGGCGCGGPSAGGGLAILGLGILLAPRRSRRRPLA